MAYKFKKGIRFRSGKKEYSYSITNGEMHSFIGGLPLKVETSENLETIIKNLEESEDFKYLHLGEISQEDLNTIISRIGKRIVELDINSIIRSDEILDLKVLKKCKKLRKVKLSFSERKIKLWNTRFNHKLMELEITGARALYNQNGLKSLKAKTLIIKRYSHGVSNIKELLIKDFSIFETMPNLEKLVLSIKSKKNKENDLLSLSKLVNLKTLILPKNYFFFNQYAWLTSKLPEVGGLGCYRVEYDHANEMDSYIINGSRMNWYVRGYETNKLNKYINKFNKLVEQYKNEDVPPLN